MYFSAAVQNPIFQKMTCKVDLFQAIVEGNDRQRLEKCITEREIDVLNDADELGNNLIHYCASGCRHNCLDVLLTYARKSSALVAYVNFPNSFGRTPLHLACFAGWHTIVNQLLNVEGILPDKQTNAGCTPLYLACSRGHSKIVETLLSSNVNPNTQTNNGSSPLIAAATCGSVPSIKVLISAGANANGQNNDGKTAAHIAAEKQDKQMMDLLVSLGASLDIKDNRGRTAADAFQNNEQTFSFMTF